MTDTWPTLTRGLPYPSFAKACFAVTIDNGGINRTRSAKAWRGDYRKWAVAQQDLTEINAWCATLTNEQITEWAIGGDDEPEKKRLQASAPAFADQMLDKYFDEVG